MKTYEERNKRIENYIQNMNWSNIRNNGVKETMVSIISQHQNGRYLTDGQVNALRRTCIRSNNAGRYVPYSGASHLSSTWRSVNSTGGPRG